MTLLLLSLSLSFGLWGQATMAAAGGVLHTYGVPLLGSQPEQRITIDPPALELQVTTQPAGIVLRCGDNHKTYTCKAGQPTLISSDSPITEFWVQHTTDENANLQVNVYRYAEQSDRAPSSSRLESNSRLAPKG
ncbi:MAG: hypothetical protein HC818_03360 [Synechococcaceae cyanobacterium RM1_1_27]|nr:hypothetical protein [Synechococcaceae cyanobacterium RM1_1_27]